MSAHSSTKLQIGILASLVLAILVGLSIFVVRLLSDTEPVDDSDLALTEREIDPVQNPFPEIREFNLTDEELKEISRAWEMLIEGSEPVDEAFLEALFAEHAKSLATFERYAAMTDWKLDQELSFYNIYTYFIPWMGIAKLQSARTIRLIQNGQPMKGVDKVSTVIGFSNGMQDSQGEMFHLVAGTHFLRIAQDTIIHPIEDESMPSKALESLANILEEVTLNSNTYSESLRAEYQVLSYMLDDLSTRKNINQQLLMTESESVNEIPTSLVYKKNKTKKLFADATRLAIEDCKQSPPEFPGRLAPFVEDMRDKSTWSRMLSGNAGGAILFLVGPPVHEGMRKNWTTTQARHQLLRARVALERHRRKHGEWPAELDALVPAYLSSIPLDPFDAQPIRYDPGRKLLWSIGEDQIDDSGVPPDKPGSLESKKEIIIELEPDDSPQSAR